MSFRVSASIAVIAFALAACSQGSSIESPGATNPGTAPGGGGSGGGGGGGGSTVACPTGFAEGAAVGGLTTCDIAGSVLTNLTLEAVDGVAYRLDGRVDIGSDVGGAGGGQSAVLTIEPGAVVFGSSGSDYLVVNRGSRIEAEGTLANPIIFTSENDLERQADNDPTNDDGGDSISEWGGLVILGQAPINRCRDAATPGTADCENFVEGVTNPEAVYGGSNPNDDSGALKYVQVRFAGFAVNTQGNELNGITFGGVGSNTDLDYIQVHNNSDDGVEFFGGTANVKHLVLTGNDDDSVDTDNGYQGHIQHLVVVQRAGGGDNIFEASSSAPGVSPLSDATISNFTIVGRSGGGNAWRLNSGTVGHYVNGVVDHPDACFRWEGSAGDGAAGYNAANDPNFASILFDCDGGLQTANSDQAAPSAAVADDANNVIRQNSLAARFFPGANETGVAAFDVTTIDPFFDAVTYVGAFSPTETETNNWAAGWTFALFPDPVCPVGTTDSGAEINGQTVCNLAGQVLDDIRLTRGNLYRINGRIDIGEDIGADGNRVGGDPASLTIESGVTMFGESGDDYIVVNRGSQIFSNGTATNPVILTSEDDVLGSQIDPDNSIGEWGGLVILGRAPINRCRDAAAPGSADCENFVEGVTNPEAVYGGGINTDSSGTLRYTQVRFAGYAINTQGNELNGITFGGVGNGTEVDYVQVHNNSDDGVEFFGGSVNARHLVLTGNDDDSVDTDNGYQGNIQYLIVVQRPGGGDNGFEASSSAPGVAPLSDATIANFTLVGRAGGGNAWRLNSGTVGHYLNGVVEHPGECFRWEGSAGDGVAGYSAAGDSNFNSVLFDCAGGLQTANSDQAAPSAAVADDANNVIGQSSLAGGFINGANETAVTAFDLTTLDPFFDDTDYIGAVRDNTDRWWAGWTCGLEAANPC